MQLRRASILCMVVLISCVLIGCDNTPKEAGRYYDEGKGFSIKFPDGWEKQKAPMGVLVTFGSHENTAAVGVQKQKVSPQQTLADCIEFMESHIQRNRGRIIDRGEAIIADTDAYWMLCDFGSENLLGYYIKKEDHIYSILATAEENDFFEDEMRQVARSFRFE